MSERVLQVHPIPYTTARPCTKAERAASFRTAHGGRDKAKLELRNHHVRRETILLALGVGRARQHSDGRVRRPQQPWAYPHP